MFDYNNFYMRKIGIILGNGRYALYVLNNLTDWDPIAVSLVPQLYSCSHPAIKYRMNPLDAEKVIKFFHDESVTHVIFAGDLGILKIREIVRDILWRPGRAAIIAEYMRAVQSRPTIVSALQFIHDKLVDAGITPILASEVLPELQPPLGNFAYAGREVSEDHVAHLVKATVAIIGEQPKKYVRQAAIFDDQQCIGQENESTDALLRRCANIPKPQNALRTLIKICPRQVYPTIDAPVIGSDTIYHCGCAKVDLIIVDHIKGIISNISECITKSDEYKISIYGANVDTILEN